MKRYIRSTSNNQPTVEDVWNAIPKEYRPYIDEISIVPQYSYIRNKEVITYNATFKSAVYEGDKEPLIGVFHAEDVQTLVDGIVKYLSPKFPEIHNQIMDRWHPKRNRGW